MPLAGVLFHLALRLDHLLERERDLHAQDLGAVEQPLGVLAQANVNNNNNINNNNVNNNNNINNNVTCYDFICKDNN